MAHDWTVAVFGDSWAKYMTPTWPEQLARRLGVPCNNFAMPGGVAANLHPQAQTAILSPQMKRAAGGLLARETLVVVHIGGNDFIAEMAQIFMGSMTGNTGGLERSAVMQRNPGQREAAQIKQFLETMYRAGARNFLVSGVPAFIHMPVYNMIWPVTANLVNQGKLESLGVGPGDPPQLALEVQGIALADRWNEMVNTFNQEHPDGLCVFFDEVDQLHMLRERLGEAAFDSQMWDFSMFHPSGFGHEMIGEAAHQQVLRDFHGIVGGSVAPTPSAAPTPSVATVPPVAAPVGTNSVALATANGPAITEPAITTCTAPAEKRRPVTLQVKTVKGDAVFAVSSDLEDSVPELRAAICRTAPDGLVQPGMKCALAYKGKFLDDAQGSLAECGVEDGAQMIMVLKKG